MFHGVQYSIMTRVFNDPINQLLRCLVHLVITSCVFLRFTQVILLWYKVFEFYPFEATNCFFKHSLHKILLLQFNLQCIASYMESFKLWIEITILKSLMWMDPLYYKMRINCHFINLLLDHFIGHPWSHNAQGSYLVTLKLFHQAIVTSWLYFFLYLLSTMCYILFAFGEKHDGFL